mmetsp:Transcript_62207/g.86497  ORF Transcript_62207/g.86497 Transcript_62207/m.86497 type:complete len:197 (+) Transcript_62207:88-678(+)
MSPTTSMVCRLALVTLLAYSCTCQVFFSPLSISEFPASFGDDQFSALFSEVKPASQFSSFSSFSSFTTFSFGEPSLPNGVSSLFSNLLEQQHIVSVAQDAYDRYYTLSDTSEVQPLVSDLLSLIDFAGGFLGSEYAEYFPFKQTYTNNEEFVDAFLEENPYLTPTREELFENAYASSASTLSPALVCLGIVAVFTL